MTSTLFHRVHLLADDLTVDRSGGLAVEPAAPPATGPAEPADAAENLEASLADRLALLQADAPDDSSYWWG